MVLPMPRPVALVFQALTASLFMNALFLAIVFYFASLPQAAAGEAIERAFVEGELVEQDYLQRDWLRGKNQYNDCVVLQLVANPGVSLPEKALAPTFYVTKPAPSDVCATLRRLVEGKANPSTLLADSYGRYWHGYVPVTAALLSITDIGTARQCLRLLVAAALLALAASAGFAGGALRIAGISVAVTGLLFWGLPYYGQGFSYAPGDAVTMFGLAALVAWRKALQMPSRLAVFSASYGALVTYFDMLTGPIPTAACLLFVFAYLATSDERRGWESAFSAFAAFALGALVTTVAKQLLVAGLLGAGKVEPFLSNLGLYTGLSGGWSTLPATWFNAFFNLFMFTPLLTYFSYTLGAALLAASAIAWAAAAYLALRSRSSRLRSGFLAHAVGASGIALWVLLLPAHTEIHAFMSRMLLVPFSLGWSALALQLLLRQGDAGSKRAG